MLHNLLGIAAYGRDTELPSDVVSDLSSAVASATKLFVEKSSHTYSSADETPHVPSYLLSSDKVSIFLRLAFYSTGKGGCSIFVGIRESHRGKL
jgi:hypothetical protein